MLWAGVVGLAAESLTLTTTEGLVLTGVKALPPVRAVAIGVTALTVLAQLRADSEASLRREEAIEKEILLLTAEAMMVVSAMGQAKPVPDSAEPTLVQAKPRIKELPLFLRGGAENDEGQGPNGSDQRPPQKQPEDGTFAMEICRALVIVGFVAANDGVVENMLELTGKKEVEAAQKNDVETKEESDDDEDEEENECQIETVFGLFGIVNKNTTLCNVLTEELCQLPAIPKPLVLAEGTIVEPYQVRVDPERPDYYNVTVYSGHTTDTKTTKGSIPKSVFVEQPRPLSNVGPETERYGDQAQYPNDRGQLGGKDRMQNKYPQMYKKFDRSPYNNGQPSPSDVIQGQLGDCMLMATLRSLAQYKNGQIIKDILPDKAGAPFKVTLLDFTYVNDQKIEHFSTETVDAYFVVDRNDPDRRLYATFKHTNGENDDDKRERYDRETPLWPAIIEKALAQSLGGNFKELNWGHAEYIDILGEKPAVQSGSIKTAQHFDLLKSHDEKMFKQYLTNEYGDSSDNPVVVLKTRSESDFSEKALKKLKGDYNFKGNHGYSLKDFDGVYMELKNPWGARDIGPVPKKEKASERVIYFDNVQAFFGYALVYDDEYSRPDCQDAMETTCGSEDICSFGDGN